MDLRRCIVATVVAATSAIAHSGVEVPLSTALATPVVPAGLEAAVPEATVPPAPSTTTAVTEPPPVPTTTTTTTAAVAPPPPPAITKMTTRTPTTTTSAPAPRRAAAAADRAARVVAILDSAGWDWRAAGITVRIGDHPDDPGRWGIYDARTREVWVGRGAFAGPARLRYVVLHEAAHGWQYTSGHLSVLSADLAAFGHRGVRAALEAGADCVATLWGATTDHYWNCPAAARSVMARRLAGDWS